MLCLTICFVCSHVGAIWRVSQNTRVPLAVLGKGGRRGSRQSAAIYYGVIIGLLAQITTGQPLLNWVSIYLAAQQEQNALNINLYVKQPRGVVWARGLFNMVRPRAPLFYEKRLSEIEYIKNNVHAALHHY